MNEGVIATTSSPTRDLRDTCAGGDDRPGALGAEGDRPVAGRQAGVDVHRLHHVDEVEAGRGDADLHLAGARSASRLRAQQQPVERARGGGDEPDLVGRRGARAERGPRAGVPAQPGHHALSTSAAHLRLTRGSEQFFDERAQVAGADVDERRMQRRQLRGDDPREAPPQRTDRRLDVTVARDCAAAVRLAPGQFGGEMGDSGVGDRGLGDDPQPDARRVIRGGQHAHQSGCRLERSGPGAGSAVAGDRPRLDDAERATGGATARGDDLAQVVVARRTGVLDAAWPPARGEPRPDVLAERPVGEHEPRRRRTVARNRRRGRLPDELVDERVEVTLGPEAGEAHTAEPGEHRAVVAGHHHVAAHADAVPTVLVDGCHARCRPGRVCV